MPEGEAMNVQACTVAVPGAVQRTSPSDFERITLFGILFRSHADQSRRMDSVDATLGVVLTALLVLAPIAFDKGPTQIDKWFALVSFGLLVVIVAWGLFMIRAQEPNAPALGAKLLGDLKDPVAGTLEEVRIAIRTAADSRHVATKNEMLRRGAAGDLVQAIAEDRQRLGSKRFHLGVALAMFVVLTGIIGWRDVIQSLQEDPGNGVVRIHREAVGTADQARRPGANSGIRRSDVR
ncbi:MAG: hypothetical protein M3169_18360 [Candidatus Eremiobacteraeota bacterium]|nr:hypothetical protein [Candidatus Eremiobacteraeota bacterium]